MDGALRAILVDDHDRRVAAHDHVAALRILNDIALLDLHNAVEVRLQRRLIHDLGTRHAAQMEGTHGELGTRLADRLRRDDTDGFAHIDGRTAGKIAPVALAANAAAGLASQRRADADLLDARILDLFDLFLADPVSGLDDHLAGGLVLDVVARGTAEHTH